MRRSLLTPAGVAALLFVAACTPDQPARDAIVPTAPSFANSPQCSGNLASDIAKLEKELFTNPSDLQEMQDQFTLVKGACPISVGDADFPVLMTYIDLMIGNRTSGNAPGLAGLLHSVTLYATGAGVVRPPSVFSDEGGAGVMFVSESAGDEMVTFDKGARLAFEDSTKAILQKTPLIQVPFGARLFTFEPRSAEECGDISSLRGNTRGDGASCYDIQDYPDAVEYTPAATLTICMHTSIAETEGIIHDRAGFGEVLPRVTGVVYSCGDFHTSSNSWLERKGGPLGRALARAYDFVAPKTLIADDVGESGSIGSFSLVGGVLNDIFEDNFDDAVNFNDGVDTPDLGDGNWIIAAQSPGFIRIQDALGNMSGGVVVLSQAQGACNNCPVLRLLGTVKTEGGEGDFETTGSYDVTWQSLQNKPSVKEAPFMLFNGTPNNNNTNQTEIARLSYVTVSSQNKLLFKVQTDTGLATFDVGTWTQNQSQNFRIQLNLTTLNPATSKTVSLYLNDALVAGPIKAARATAFKHLGYVLMGIDAGILASDNWFATRLSDAPPQ